MADPWDTVLLVVASLIAVSSLLRLMRARRDRIITEVQKQVDAHTAEAAKQAKTAATKKKQDAA